MPAVLVHCVLLILHSSPMLALLQVGKRPPAGHAKPNCWAETTHLRWLPSLQAGTASKAPAGSGLTGGGPCGGVTGGFGGGSIGLGGDRGCGGMGEGGGGLLVGGGLGEGGGGRRRDEPNSCRSFAASAAAAAYSSIAKAKKKNGLKRATGRG